MGYYGDTRMRPSEIRFIQDSIASYFQDGRGTVHDAIKRIQCGYLSPDDFPPIKVVLKDWKVYSFDNRRLYVFRVCEVMGCVLDIPVQIRPIWELREDRVTTFDDGRTIYVRGDTTEKHCLEHWFRQQDTAGNWNLSSQPVSVIKEGKDNVDSVNEYIDSVSNTSEVASVENNIPKSNIFSISRSNNNLRSTSLLSISRSGDAEEYSEDDINNNSNVPSPNIAKESNATCSKILPTSSHSSRVYIAANFGEKGFDNPIFLAASPQSSTSDRKSSSNVSIYGRNRTSQDYPFPLIGETVIVDQPKKTETRQQDASKDSPPADDISSSEKSTSILARIFKTCCCCCPSTN